MARQSYSLNKVCCVFLCFLTFGLSSCNKSQELEWNEEKGYRWAELPVNDWGNTGFRQLNESKTGIKFINDINEEKILENRHYLNGSGVATGDVNGDGLIDIYFAQLDGPNKLFKNEGNFQFKDITDEAGVSHNGYNSTGVVFTDVDGDNDLDLLVTSLTDGNALYINDGTGKFKLHNNSVIGPSEGSNSMALADIDGDGDLDLYITNFKTKTVRDIYTKEELSTSNTVHSEGDSLYVIPPFDEHYGIIETEDGVHRLEYGAQDRLYINDGEGNFEEDKDLKDRFLSQDGKPKGFSPDWGLTPKFQDINGDLLPDLYVANDFWTPDRIWINQGSGIFQSMDSLAVRSFSYSSMGIDFSDINRDGFIDFFVAEMLSNVHERRLQQYAEYLGPLNGRPQFNKNSLYLNRGDTTFAEIAYYSGLAASEWSWATNFLDIDFDGYEDLLITTGHPYDYQDMDTQLKLDRSAASGMNPSRGLLEYPTLQLKNKIFKNNGDLTFTEQSEEWGSTEKDISWGLAIADFNNDGAPDFVVNRFNSNAVLYENESTKDRIAVRLEGKRSNTDAIGAKIELKGGADVIQTKEIAAGGSYVSGSDYEVYFAADSDNDNHVLTVKWPGYNGQKISKIDSLKANRKYIIEEPEELESRVDKEKKNANYLFKDISDRINHRHHEDSYNDFNVQSLLPVKVSRQGPGISWIDFDRDRDDDLFISSGKGGILGIFENKGDGKFDKANIQNLNDTTVPGDQTTILGWASQESQNLLIGSANFEQGDPAVPSGYHYSLTGKDISEKNEIPGILSTTGPLAAADYNGDGQIDIFVGGRFNPGRYPENASSRLFANNNGNFELDKRNSQKLIDLGLVTGAVFTDYDGDGDPDLLLSREWDSIILLENRDGIFHDVSSEVGLESYKGWWNGIATGDFNNDGLPDIIATNMGSNSLYQIQSNSNPLKLFYQDFNNNGRPNIVEAYYDEDIGSYVPRRKLYDFDSIPRILQYIDSHQTFATSSLDDIFGINFERVPAKEINTLQHMLFINQGNSFNPKPLPAEAQFSAAYHAGIADVDNDGNEDLFISQNLFSLFPGVPRMDAGRGLLMKGDGEGNLTVVPGHTSGIKNYGQQRGASFSDFNKDGKIDLAVSQNDDETKLYLNKTNKNGIRVRLIGSDDNLNAIGSSLRIVYEDGSLGPLREIKAGSGYWSQPTLIPVLGYKQKPIAVKVKWFDGSTQEYSIEKINQSQEIVIRYQS